LLVLAACPSLSTLGGPDPVPCGRWQLGGALEGVGGNDARHDWKSAGPQLELTARRGLRPDLDLGFKLYVLGVEGGVKWRFRHGAWPMAIAPSLGAIRTRDFGLTTDATFLFLHVAGLVGHELSPRWKLAFGPKLLYDAFIPATNGFGQGFAVGAFVNADWRFGAHGRWHLVPELNLYRVVAGTEPVDGGMFQGGVALLCDL
jgi:hypothetical protein